MKRKIHVTACGFLFLALILTLSPAALGGTVIVVNHGKYASAEQAASDEKNVNWTDADLGDDIVCTASFAAVELQRYLRKMTVRSGDFVIAKPETLASISGQTVICLATFDELKKEFLENAKIAAAAFGPEGYVIKSVIVAGNPGVVIAAPGRIGLLYGAYDFLHRLGVRWYAPGPQHEVVPRKPLDPFPSSFDVAETPAFLTRGFHAWEDRADRDFLLWMARNRLNYWCVEQSDKPFLHKLGIKLVGGGHVLTSLYLGPNLGYPYNHPQFKGDEEKAADPYPVSPDYHGDADANGRLSYFEAHPEWYGLVNGKRSPRIEGDFGDNFCTSNADAMAEWTKNAVADLAIGRCKDATFMNAWTLDVGSWCECENCRALGTPTDRNILFVHAYAKAIKEAQARRLINRPVRLLFLAYADVLEPPTKPLPADFDDEMCIATFFPIVRCYVHEFDDPHCSKNADYLKNLTGWFLESGRHYRGQVCIGEYYNVSGYKCLPVVFMHTMAHDIPFYYRSGARHFHYMHVTTDRWGSRALTNWQMARQLWDPGVDAESLWRDFFEGRYGPAYRVMREFYEAFEAMLSNVSELKYSLGRRLGRGEPNLFPDRHLQYEKTVSAADDGPDLVEILEFARRSRRLIDEAMTMKTPRDVAGRIAEDERVFRYAERTVLFYDALCRATFGLAREHKDAARAALWTARELALLLQADTLSTKFSSSHANAADGLEASYAAPALERLGKESGVGTNEALAAAPFYSDKSNLLFFRDEKGVSLPVSSPNDWEIRRHHILLNFQKVAGVFPVGGKDAPLNLKILAEDDIGGVVRKKISFEAEPGSSVRAYLFIPQALALKAPAALCLHQTTRQGKDEPAGISGNPDLFQALELARRGYVALAPDYPGYGEDDTDPYALGYGSATMKGIRNHVRAVDVLVSLPEVDAERIAVIGHSLGGHNAIFVALFDPRLKAVVTSCGFTSFRKYYGGDLTGWSHKGYMPRIASAYGKDPARMPFDFHELLAALAPRPVFINAPLKDGNFEVSGVDDCVRAAEPIYEFLGAAGGKIVVVHPDAGHSFPPEIRKQAYEFLDRALASSCVRRGI